VRETFHSTLPCGRFGRGFGEEVDLRACPAGFPSPPEENPSILEGVDVLPVVVAEFEGGDPSLDFIGCDCESIWPVSDNPGMG
jgi:hypothetical protein